MQYLCKLACFANLYFWEYFWTFKLVNYKEWSNEHFVCSFVCVNQTFCVGLTTPTQTTFLGFCLQVFCLAEPQQRIDCLAQWEISVKCLCQGRNDALPVRESNQGSATFRSLAWWFTTELSPTPFNHWSALFVPTNCSSFTSENPSRIGAGGSGKQSLFPGWELVISWVVPSDALYSNQQSIK